PRAAVLARPAARAARRRGRFRRRPGSGRQTPGTRRAPTSPSAIGPALAQFLLERVGHVAEAAAFGQRLDALFGIFESVVAEARETDAAFEQRERLLERKVALLERVHDLVEFGHCRLEVLGLLWSGHGTSCRVVRR